MMRLTCLAVAAAALSASHAARAQTTAGDACIERLGAFAGLSGRWTTEASVDEGGSGAGSSRISVAADRICAVTEEAEFALKLDDGRAVESASITVIAWDALSETWKLMTTDSRGYTHIARGGFVGPDQAAFEVVAADDAPVTRRILYRNLSADGFTWVWQGRDDARADWSDRFVTEYQRSE